MSSKIKFDFNSVKFRLWMWFLGFSVVAFLLIWFLQIYFLNNSYETMKTKEVSRIASMISHAYKQNDENLTSSI